MQHVELIGGPYCGSVVPWDDTLTRFVRLRDDIGPELYVREDDQRALWSRMRDSVEGAA